MTLVAHPDANSLLDGWENSENLFAGIIIELFSAMMRAAKVVAVNTIEMSIWISRGIRWAQSPLISPTSCAIWAMKSCTKATRDGGKKILVTTKTEIGEILCFVDANKYREHRKIGVGMVRTLYCTLNDYEAILMELAYGTGHRQYGK
jgi:hypothetical protein